MEGREAIVFPYYYLVHGHNYFLVSRYHPKGDVLNSCHSFTHEQILQVFVQMLLAVYVVHACNLAHMDISCENFVVSLDEDGLDGDEQSAIKVYLIDFGLSKLVERVPESQFGANLPMLIPSKDVRYGKDWYSSYELLTRDWNKQSGTQGDAGSVTAYVDLLSCDIWALGVVLYALLMKTPPFPKSGLIQDIKTWFGKIESKSLFTADVGVANAIGSRTKAPLLSTEVKDLVYRILSKDCLVGRSKRLTIEELLSAVMALNKSLGIEVWDL